jgi:hypothetical protein
MKSVWKYDVEIGGDVPLAMPVDARIVHVAAQQGPTVVQLWAEVETTAPKVTRQFFIAGTGHPIENGAEYIGTAICLDGALVWHLYELHG